MNSSKYIFYLDLGRQSDVGNLHAVAHCTGFKLF